MRLHFDDVIRYGKRASSDNSWLKRALFRYGKRADDVTEEDVMRALYQSGMYDALHAPWITNIR